MMRKYLAVVGYHIPETGKGFPATIEDAAVQQMKKLFEGRMVLKEAADYLGIGRRHVRQLVDTGLLVEDPIHKGVVRGRRVLVKQDLDNLVARVCDGLAAASTLDIAGLGLRALPKTLGQCRGVGMGQACQMLLDGTLTLARIATGQRGFANVLTTSSAIMEAIRRQDGGSMSYREAAEVLQLHPEDLRLLVKAGAIGHKIVNSNHISISRAAVMTFGKQYVGSRVLAADLGVAHNKVAVTLRNKGKKPAFDRHKIPGLHGSIFERQA